MGTVRHPTKKEPGPPPFDNEEELRAATAARAAEEVRALFGQVVPEAWIVGWRAEIERLAAQEQAAREVAQRFGNGCRLETALRAARQFMARLGVDPSTWPRNVGDFIRLSPTSRELFLYLGDESRVAEGPFELEGPRTSCRVLTMEEVRRITRADGRRQLDGQAVIRARGRSLVRSRVGAKHDRRGDRGGLPDISEHQNGIIWIFERCVAAVEGQEADRAVFLTDRELAAIWALLFPEEINVVGRFRKDRWTPAMAMNYHRNRIRIARRTSGYLQTAFPKLPPEEREALVERQTRRDGRRPVNMPAPPTSPPMSLREMFSATSIADSDASVGDPLARFALGGAPPSRRDRAAKK